MLRCNAVGGVVGLVSQLRSSILLHAFTPGFLRLPGATYVTLRCSSHMHASTATYYFVLSHATMGDSRDFYSNRATVRARQSSEAPHRGRRNAASYGHKSPDYHIGVEAAVEAAGNWF